MQLWPTAGRLTPVMRKSILGLTLLLATTSCTTGLQPASESSRSATRQAPAGAGNGTTTDPTVGTVTTPARPSQPEEMGWVRVSHDEAVFGGGGDQVVMAVEASPLGLVAVGIDEGEPDINEDDTATIWLSSDGSTWTRAANDPTFRDAEIRDVVWFSASAAFVAVGRYVSDGAVWLSADGTSWSRVALLPFAHLGGGIEMESVIAAGPGLVAVGREWLSEGASIPAVWTSTDGRVWGRVEVDMCNLQEENENAIVDVADHGTGLLAVGFIGTSARTYEPAIWSSSDGTSWQAIEISDADARSSVLRAIEANDQLVWVVGDSEAEHVDARAWRSTDRGQTWTPKQVETGQVGIPALNHITDTPTGWVAVGADGTTRHEFGETIAAVWQSSDGYSWIRHEPRQISLLPTGSATGVVMTAVSAFGGAVVAGGFEGATCATRFNRCDLDAAFWLWMADVQR